MLSSALQALSERWKTWALLTAIWFVIWLPLLPFMKTGAIYLVTRVLPVSFDWTPAVVLVDGPDMVVRGTMRKWLSCKYEPPPRAGYYDEDGVRHPLSVTSSSQSRGDSWSGDLFEKRAFGPWRVMDAAGKGDVCFELEHVCGDLRVFSKLGCVSAPKGTE